MAKGPYKLKLTKLQWLSSVDAPAQGDGARALLIKRKGPHEEIEFSARVSKLNDELGLVFGHAFSSSLDGGATLHVDYQEDAIDPDFIKTAMEFMEAGGPTDVNHDCAPDGRIVFAWPLVPEVNAAMGIKSDVIGLAIAVKPSAETYAKFKSGELAGFSLYGTGTREPLGKQHKEPVTLKSAPTRVVKGSLYTDEVDGHQHEICVYDDGSFYVRYATAAGAEREHSHGIVYENGALTILADSGHSHVLADGQPSVAVVPADAIVVVAARDTRAGSASKSTRPTAPQQSGPTTEETMSNTPDLSKQLADLTKQNERLARIAKMSGAHKAHFDTLTGDDAEAFLAKSTADRETVVQKALEDDQPIWTGEVTKVAVRKRDGELALMLAKQNEMNAVALAKREAEIEKAEVASIAKAHLGKLAGDDETHAYIVASVRKGGGSAELVTKALTAMKGWNEIATVKATAPGSDGAGTGTATGSGDPMEALEKGLVAFAKANSITKNVWTDGLAKFVKTDEGAALKRAVDEATAG